MSIKRMFCRSLQIVLLMPGKWQGGLIQLLRRESSFKQKHFGDMLSVPGNLGSSVDPVPIPHVDGNALVSQTHPKPSRTILKKTQTAW